MQDRLLRARVVIRNVTSSFGRLLCTKKRAARGARLTFLIQPIISLICGVAVAVAIVIS